MSAKVQKNEHKTTGSLYKNFITGDERMDLRKPNDSHYDGKP